MKKLFLLILLLLSSVVCGVQIYPNYDPFAYRIDGTTVMESTGAGFIDANDLSTATRDNIASAACIKAYVDSATLGMLTEEVDPNFNAWLATVTPANWDSAYGWGDHTGLYLPISGGTLTGHLLFTDNTYDIGADGATRPKDLYLAGTLYAGYGRFHSLTDVMGGNTADAEKGITNYFVTDAFTKSFPTGFDNSLTYTNNNPLEVPSFMYGLNFSASWMPDAGISEDLYGSAAAAGYGQVAIQLDSDDDYGAYLYFTMGYYSRLLLNGGGYDGIGDGTGVAGVYGLHCDFFAANPICEGQTYLEELYAFYEEGMTQGNINWGLGINTQSYINAALSIGKATAPTAGTLNLASGYNIEKDTNDLTITCASAKTVVLSPVVYEDLQVGINNIAKGASAPTDRTYAHGVGSGIAYPVLGFAKNNYIWFDVQTQHGMKLNTVLDCHIHFVLPNTTSVGHKIVWQLDVLVAGIDGTWSVPTGSPFTATHTVAANDDTKHRILDIADIPASNSTVSTVYKCKLTRIDGTATEYASEVYLEFVDCHYQKDTMGSRQEKVK